MIRYTLIQICVKIKSNGCYRFLLFDNTLAETSAITQSESLEKVPLPYEDALKFISFSY